jgi:hypothetical protein
MEEIRKMKDGYAQDNLENKEKIETYKTKFRGESE